MHTCFRNEKTTVIQNNTPVTVIDIGDEIHINHFCEITSELFRNICTKERGNYFIKGIIQSGSDSDITRRFSRYFLHGFLNGNS